MTSRIPYGIALIHHTFPTKLLGVSNLTEEVIVDGKEIFKQVEARKRLSKRYYLC